jgi:hypothetical protein
VDLNKVIDIANGLYLEFKDKDFAQHAKTTKRALAKRETKEESAAEWSGFFKKIGNMVQEYF